jgi:urea carboxylase
MRVCRDARELIEAFAAVQRLGQNNFSDAGVFLEKYIERARHLEVQIFGDGRGRSSPSACATAQSSGVTRK